MAKKKAPEKPVSDTPVEEPTETPAEPESRDIDDRMASLLEDHQEMGARPKD